MKRIAVLLSFDPDDGAFDELDASDIHGALCRGYPFLRMSELAVQQLEEHDPRTTFHDALVSLNATYAETPGPVRAEILIVAALAVLDAHQTAHGAGADATSEERFTGFCGASFRRMRQLGMPGGPN